MNSHSSTRLARGLAAVTWLAAVLLLTPSLHATWSIVAADTETQEVAIGSATCVAGLDLKAISPAVAVGLGGGAAQSFQDTSGVRRQTIYNGLVAGKSSTRIMQELIALSGSSNHQNGVADTGGDSATFSGSSTGAHSSGVTGTVGTTFYAIQGNLLTGSPVVTEAELAFVNTSGDLPAKLMAAMEAARAFGGDGRCSCSGGNPTGCGAPPPSFTKSSHIGFMIVARYGDTDGAQCDSNGCARGDYFLDFNVPFQSSGDTDPVFQLQSLFDSFRQAHLGRPDAVASSVIYTPSGNDSVMTIALADWQGVPLAGGGDSVTVTHAPGSAGISSIGPVTDNGDGTYELTLTRGQGSGVDLFDITVDDGVRVVMLPPRKAPLDLTDAQCGNGVCELGEDCNSCPSDCPVMSGSGAECGNGICEAVDGESCSNCAQDCNGRTNGPPSQRFCCGDGDCGNPGCSSGGFTCTTDPAPPAPICCGDLVCEPPEDSVTCAVDCGCTVGEDPEATCDDSADNDCDGFVDCADSDCATDPACNGGGCSLGQQGDPCSVDGDCCSNKCKGPSGNRTCR